MTDETRVTIRLPAPMRDWLRKKAEADFTSQNTAILHVIRAQMEKEASQ